MDLQKGKAISYESLIKITIFADYTIFALLWKQ
jgi:hypothetical protein